jgi:peptidoglycan/xylan/chitin deacetylase (PgdA/CDA1 family)
MTAKTKSLPVLMYHYVSAHQNSIAVYPEVFDEHLRAMAEEGYRGVSLAEAEGYLLEGRELPAGSVLISFDDGYLDNYVYACPMLANHGHQGVVFAVTNKIESEPHLRPTLEDVWNGYVEARDLPPVDQPFRHDSEGLRIRRDLFFSWDEARKMEESGVMRVSAHSHRHRSVFSSPSFEGLFKPTGRKRTFDRVEQEVAFGMPRFTVGPALANRAFLPSQRVYELARELTPQGVSQASHFFSRQGAEERVMARMAELPAEALGRFETDEEFRTRVYEELAACRDTLKRELGETPKSLCWPWGESCPESEQIARELGFLVQFYVSMGANPPGRRPGRVHRFKAKNKPASWLLSRLGIYSNPVKAAVYGKVHG